MRLNAGCGRDYRESWVNLDRANNGRVDVVHDLTDIPLPFDDGVFDHIFTKDTLEEIPKTSIEALIEDFHRILRVGGILEIIVPWGHSFEVQDISSFTEFSLNKYLVNPIRWKGRRFRDFPVKSLNARPIFRCIECKVRPFRTPLIPINIFRQQVRWVLEKI